MTDWHVGQLIICVNDDFPDDAGKLFSRLPRKGEVFTIRQVGVCPVMNALGIRVEEIIGVMTVYGIEQGFFASRFRPARKTSLESFTAILNRTPELVDS